MKRTSKMVLGASAAAAVAVAGAGAAAAGNDDDATDRPITGPALEQASEAALKHTKEGRVTETEVGDEEGAYEVEVTLDNGDEVDVHLNEDFAVLGTEAEDADDNDD